MQFKRFLRQHILRNAAQFNVRLPNKWLQLHFIVLAVSYVHRSIFCVQQSNCDIDFIEETKTAIQI